MNGEQAVKLVWSWVHWALVTVVGVGLLGVLAATIAARYGFTQRLIPAADPNWLAYICGAWWLYRKAGA